MQWSIWAAVAVGGATGSLLRYFIASAIQRPTMTFPIGILIVNVTGGLIMGLIVEASALRLQLSPELRAFLTVGILGGYTTFSTFSLDSALLIERGDYIGAALYIGGSVILSILALFTGLWIVRAVV
jgi:CrcB protein